MPPKFGAVALGVCVWCGQPVHIGIEFGHLAVCPRVLGLFPERSRAPPAHEAPIPHVLLGQRVRDRGGGRVWLYLR